MEKNIKLKESKDLYEKKEILKIFFIISSLYIIVISTIFLIGGKQIYERKSRGYINVDNPTSTTVELTKGNKISQNFTNKIEMFDAFSVRFETFDRKNSGTIQVRLINDTDRKIIYDKKIDVSTITRNENYIFKLDKPLKNLYNKSITIVIDSLDGIQGTSIAPFINNIEEKKIGVLYYNSDVQNSTMCFEAIGRDSIWIGLNYWKFALIGFVLIILLYVFVKYKSKKFKKSYIMDIIYSFSKYKFLIKQLVSRDFKTKYKRSVLGVLWSLLNPLMMLAVQYAVFSNIFRFKVENYTVYLLIGQVFFTLFSESTSMALMSIESNAALIKKVYIPKYIYPFSRVISTFINFLFSLIPLFLIILLTGLKPELSWILAIFPIITILLFGLGVGLIVSTSMVFFRDTQFLWGIVTTAWMYLTPIFYPISILPNNLKWILNWNPVYFNIKFIRICIIDGVSPEPMLYIMCAFSALIALMIGGKLFYKSQDRFILYI